MSLLILIAALAAAEPHAVAEGIHLIPGDFVPGSQPDGNSVLIEAPEGLIVVDTGRHPAHTRAIIAAAQAMKQPIRAVINTHWHLDHIGGNALLRREVPDLEVHGGTAVSAALDGFLANYRGQLEQQIARTDIDEALRTNYRRERDLIDSGAALLPDEPIEASGEREIAGRTLALHLTGPAVSQGDVWIFDPAARVVVAGDLVTVPVPFLDTACPAGWIKALDELGDVAYEQLIPGHGLPLSRQQVVVYRDGLDGLVRCAASDAPSSDCADGWFAAMADIAPTSDTAFHRGILEYYVTQVLRGDPNLITARCRS